MFSLLRRFRRDRRPDGPRSRAGGPGSPHGPRRHGRPGRYPRPADGRAADDRAAAGPGGGDAGGVVQRPQAWSEDTPWGLSPRQMALAYGFNGISFGTTAGNGAGQTIAIVDAYDDPALVNSTAPNFSTSDLAQFDRQYGLPDPPSFTKLTRPGHHGPARRRSRGRRGARQLGGRGALDVEWAHAMAPAGRSSWSNAIRRGGPDLYVAAKTAAALPGVSVVSMSWGSASTPARQASTATSPPRRATRG